MTTFLIQTIDNKIKHDFSFNLIESCDYHNWFYNEKVFNYILTDDNLIVDVIPVGSVQFVLNYLKKIL